MSILPFPVQERETSRQQEICKYKFPLQKDNLRLIFRALPGSPDSQKPLAQTSPHAQEAYFGVPCSGALHLLGGICRESDQSHCAVRSVTVGRPRPSREPSHGPGWPEETQVTAGQPHLTTQQSRWDRRPEASGRKGPRKNGVGYVLTHLSIWKRLWRVPRVEGTLGRKPNVGT